MASIVKHLVSASITQLIMPSMCMRNVLFQAYWCVIELFEYCRGEVSVIVPFGPDFLGIGGIGHLLGTRLQINSSGRFALSPKRRSRIEDEIAVLKAPRPGFGRLTRCLARITLTRTNETTRSAETRNEGRTGICKARTLVWVELSPSSRHGWTYDF